MIPQILKRACGATRTFAAAIARLMKRSKVDTTEVYVSTPKYVGSIRGVRTRCRVGRRFVQRTLTEGEWVRKNSGY